MTVVAILNQYALWARSGNLRTFIDLLFVPRLKNGSYAAGRYQLEIGRFDRSHPNGAASIIYLNLGRSLHPKRTAWLGFRIHCHITQVTMFVPARFNKERYSVRSIAWSFRSVHAIVSNGISERYSVSRPVN